MLWLIKGLGIGGAERLLADALGFIDRERFEYEVAYMLPWKNALVPELEAAGIPVHPLSVSRAYDPRVLGRVARLLRRRDIRVLHSHLPSAGLIGRLASIFSPVKARVYSEHNVLGSYHPLMALMDRLTYRMDDATIAVSDTVAQSASRWPVLRPGNLVTIKNGVAVGELGDLREARVSARRNLGLDEKDFVVGNIAHLKPEKAHSVLIDSIKIASESIPDLKCVVIGQEKFPGTLDRLKAQARDLGIESNVLFTGFRTDARALTPAFDIFVLSSDFEGLPISMLEAMAMGVPPVVTDVGGIHEVVENGKDGYVVARRDPEALAGRIVELANDPSLRTAMSEAAAKKITAQFGMERVVRATEALYLDLLRRNGETLPAISGSADPAG